MYQSQLKPFIFFISTYNIKFFYELLFQQDNLFQRIAHDVVKQIRVQVLTNMKQILLLKTCYWGSEKARHLQFILSIAFQGSSHLAFHFQPEGRMIWSSRIKLVRKLWYTISPFCKANKTGCLQFQSCIHKASFSMTKIKFFLKFTG